jgi:hypothetical protein
MQKKLISFCEKVKKGRLVKFWEKSEELQTLAVYGLNHAIKNYPAIGFVRANLVPDESSVSEILKLRNRVTELETQIMSISSNAPTGSEELAQGDDLFEIRYTCTISTPKSIWNSPLYDDDTIKYNSSFELSWNSIFSTIAPFMVNEAIEYSLRDRIDDLISDSCYNEISKTKKFSNKEISNFRINDQDFQTIKIQLKSLGLIAKSTKNRSVKDTDTYWTLTLYGDNVMTRLIAIKKEKL